MLQTIQSVQRIIKALILKGGIVTDVFICQKGLKQGEITNLQGI